MKKTAKKAKKASKTTFRASKVVKITPADLLERIGALEKRVTRLEMGELHEDEDGPTLIAPK